MQQLVCLEPGTFIYQDVQKPILTPGNSIIRIKKIGICGTDIHAFDGTQPYFNYPRVLGHELAGEFVEGDAEGLNPGDAVTLIPYISCKKCIACRKGKTNCCTNIKVLGVHIDGGMSEYISVPSDIIIKGNGLNEDALALVEPLAIGAHGVRRAAVEPGEYVLVIGAGPIGLGTMAFAKIAGGHVIALDINEERLRFCREELHIPYTINGKQEDVMEKLKALTNGDMPTVVIDCTGNLNAINFGFHYLSHAGRYVLIGLQKGEISVNHPEFHKREATLMSSRNATKDDFSFVMDCLHERRIDPETFITSRLSFSSVAERFTQTVSEPSNIKTIIEF